MGIVYLGFNYATRTPVAIKLVRPEYSSIPQIRDRARAEAELTFLHPNIVRMIGICEPNMEYGPIYILSEYVDGVNFDEYCRISLSNLPLHDKVLNIVQFSIPLIEALQYIHAIGLIHRDVKPSNIRISRDGTPKLMDLGISKFEFSSSMPENGFVGTSLYGAPELISNNGIDQRVDIYAMGVTMYELLAGYNPFDSNSLESIMEKQKTLNLPNTDCIPPELYSILRKATEKDKRKRYRTAADFSSDLLSFVKYYVSDSKQISTGWFSRHKNRW